MDDTESTAPRASRNPWWTPVPLTLDQIEAVERYLVGKGDEYYLELCRLIREVES